MEKENQRSWSRTHQNQASFIASRGLEVKLLFSTSGRGRNIFLDIPLYRTGDFTQNPCPVILSAMGLYVKYPPTFSVSGLPTIHPDVRIDRQSFVSHVRAPC